MIIGIHHAQGIAVFVGWRQMLAVHGAVSGTGHVMLCNQWRRNGLALSASSTMRER